MIYNTALFLQDMVSLWSLRLALGYSNYAFDTTWFVKQSDRQRQRLGIFTMLSCRLLVHLTRRGCYHPSCCHISNCCLFISYNMRQHGGTHVTNDMLILLFQNMRFEYRHLCKHCSVGSWVDTQFVFAFEFQSWTLHVSNKANRVHVFLKMRRQAWASMRQTQGLLQINHANVNGIYVFETPI